MRIVFVKEYIDWDTYEQAVVMSPGDTAVLIDEVTGRVEIDTGFQILDISGVPSSVYTPVRDDISEEDL